jgi:hypothetical protein
VGANILDLEGSHHRSPFGGFAELIHNAYDAKATELKIGHILARAGQTVLYFQDNGCGMSPTVVSEKLFKLGCPVDEALASEPDGLYLADNLRIGKYGHGFFAGTMSIGSTAVVMTKCKADPESLTIGVLSNAPWRGRKKQGGGGGGGGRGVWPVMVHATLNTTSFTNASTRDQYNDLFSALETYTFVAPAGISAQAVKYLPGPCGTVIFIQGLGDTYHRDAELCAVKDDFMLYSKADSGATHAERQVFMGVARDGLGVHAKVPLYHSLRTLCKYMFLRPTMRIVINDKDVDVGGGGPWDHLQERKEQILRKAQAGTPPIHAILGDSAEHEGLELGGAMLYCRNVLVRPYVRASIGLHNPQEGIKTIMIVELPLEEGAFEMNQDKNDFSQTTEMSILYTKMRKTFKKYLARGWEPEVNGAELGPRNWIEAWILCDACNKWRTVSPCDED